MELASAAGQEGEVIDDWYKQLDRFGQCFAQTLQATVPDAYGPADRTRIDDLENRIRAMLEKVEKWRL